MTDVYLPSSTTSAEQRQTKAWHWYHLLPIGTIAFYMFSPTVIWQLSLPAAIERIGDLLLLVMIALAVVRMLTIDHIPVFFLVMMGFAMIGTAVAIFEGQSLTTTLWGIWMFFRFPMIGVYVYMVPDWPESLARLIPKVCVAMLAVHVAVQGLLFALGTPAGDELGGMLGRRGTGALILVLMLVLGISLGQWIVWRNWRMVGLVLFLGAISSTLGEMKLFLFAMPIMASLAVAIQLFQRGQVRRSLIFVAAVSAVAFTFILFYNAFVVARGFAQVPLQEFLFEEETRSGYFSRNPYRGSNQVTLYRGDSLDYAWSILQRDVPTTLFGMGIGTTQYNASLNIIGAGFSQGRFGLISGQTSLFSLLGEFGLAGFLLVFLLVAYTVVVLFRSLFKDGNPYLDVLRYGLLLYTLMWPLWIWYNSSLILPAPSLLYWFIWGYVLQLSTMPPITRSHLHPYPVRT